MNEINILYGFKCIRPAWTDPRMLYGLKPGALLEYTGEHPTILPAISKPRCDYCGLFVNADGYKCRSCGAPHGRVR